MSNRCNNGDTRRFSIFWAGVVLIVALLILVTTCGCTSGSQGQGPNVDVDVGDVSIGARSTLPRVAVLPELTTHVSAPPDQNGWSAPLLQINELDARLELDAQEYVQLGGQRLAINPMDGRVFLAVKNSHFTGKSNRKFRWPFRLYGAWGSFQNVVVDYVREEHAFYLELGPGDLLFERCYVAHARSNGIQLRYDAVPQQLDTYWAYDRTVTVRDCVFWQCTVSTGTRPAFTLSPKSGGPASDLNIERVYVRTHDVAHNGSYHSYGGACVEYWRDVNITDCHFDLLAPQYPVIQAFNAALPPGAQQAPVNLRIERTHIVAGDIALRPSESSTIYIDGCTGPGRIRIQTWDGSTWRTTSSVPITQGYSK